MNGIEHGAGGRDEPAVVVGVDGTRTALDAVRWAAAEALRHDLPLRILHAAPYAPEHAGPGLRRAHDILARAFTVARHAEPGLSVSTRMIHQEPAEALLRAADSALVLVLGMGGGDHLQELRTGSVALDVSGRASCPVTAVRGFVEEEGEHPVLVGVDSAAADAAALDVAFADARRHGDRLLVLHARQRSVPGDSRLAVWERLVDDLAPWAARYPDVPVELEIVDGRPTPVLLTAAVRARLVVLGTCGRGAPEPALFGSTSREVLRRCPVPVTVVRPDVVLPELSSAALDPHDRIELS